MASKRRKELEQFRGNRVALYIRVSTDQQAEEGQSLEAQEAAMRKYCQENGYLIVDKFVDAGESARTAKRPGFQRMVAVAKKEPRPFDILLVHKFDRFARNREDSAVYKALLRRDLGIDVRSVTERFDGSPIGRMVEGILEVLAEFYSANLSTEVIKGMAHKAAKGEPLGVAPFGYMIDGRARRLVISPEEAQCVRWIYEQFVLSRRSMLSLAVELREGGLPKFGAFALKPKWSQQSIRIILTNRTYLGEFHWSHDGEKFVVPNAHEAIVSRELFDRAQDMFQYRRRKKNTYGDYLLKGFGKCAICGSGMARYRSFNRWQKNARGPANTDLPYTDWICCMGYYNHTCKGIRNAIKMGELERMIVCKIGELTQGRFDLAPNQIVLKERQVTASRLNAARRKLNRIPKKLLTQMKLLEEEVIDIEEFKEAKQRVLEEKHMLETTIQQLEAILSSQQVSLQSVTEQAQQVHTFLLNNALGTEERRTALSWILDHFVWDRRTEELQIFFHL